MKRIFVIDDDESILEVIEEVLKYSEYEVKTSLTCDNVFETIDLFKPDLILIDYLLLGINGGEFCYQIKTNPKTCHIPVIMMSGFPKVFFSLGDYKCDFFITKPLDLNELMEKITLCFNQEMQKAIN